MNANKTIASVLKELLSYYGLGKFTAEVYESNGFEPGFHVGLYRELPVSFKNLQCDSTAAIEEILEPFRKDLESCQAVQDQLSDLNKINADLRSRLLSAESQITAMQKYKDYYDLSYKLQNGEMPE